MKPPFSLLFFFFAPLAVFERKRRWLSWIVFLEDLFKLWIIVPLYFDEHMWKLMEKVMRYFSKTVELLKPFLHLQTNEVRYKDILSRHKCCTGLKIHLWDLALTTSAHWAFFFHKVCTRKKKNVEIMQYSIPLCYWWLEQERAAWTTRENKEYIIYGSISV